MENWQEKLQERSRTFQGDGSDTFMNEKKWEWIYLREKCREFELEPYFQKYIHRLTSSFLCLFIIIQWFITLLHCALLLFVAKNMDDVVIDIYVYLISNIVCCVILWITFFETIIERHRWIMYICSYLVIVTITLSDLGIMIYHGIDNDTALRPSNASFVIYSIYIFMPIPEHWHCILLGLLATGVYILGFAYTTFTKHAYEDHYMHLPELWSQAIFLVCVNFLGFLTQLSKEVAIRSTFLDRRRCLEENLLFRFARDQEKGLLLRILPTQIANKIQQDVKLRIERQKRKMADGQTFLVELRKLFIEPHNDVTILYADLVNYTYLTTTLDVKTLVETIHDLFVKFDIASQRFNVLRIKFLGDCYYCVSGVPFPNEYHAKCCIDLGLSMINDIREVRQQRLIDIDMRIGVHSGSILSGVIGARKWQYDIWSKDVDIANRLEQTGVAGRVHVSEQTLTLLGGMYPYEEGTEAAKNDEILRKYEIHTFLIEPSLLEIKLRSTIDFRAHSVKTADPLPTDLPWQFSADESYIHSAGSQFGQIRRQATLEMSREMDKMPISRLEVLKTCCGRPKRLREDELEEQSLRRNVTTFLLFFRDWRREIFYMNEPDPLFKYSIFFGFITFLCILAMQAVSFKQKKPFFIVMTFATVVLVACVFIAWYRKLWIMWIGETNASIPKNKFSLMLYHLSEQVQGNVLARITIYVILLSLQCSATLFQVIDCNKNDVQIEQFEKNVLDKNDFQYHCFYPWSITNAWVLTIGTIFAFTRIPFTLKLILGTSMLVVYFSLVLLDFDIIFEKSNTTNLRLPAEYAHLMVPLVTLIVFHLVDRQTEFISKVDFNWKKQLLKKQSDAKFTNDTIKILINNILPSHVADIYIEKQMQHELYYEEYENVAIMFATIRNYDAENFGLRVLNEIICDFDEILSSYNGQIKVEKIKVAGWTYMAACGLDVKRSGSSSQVDMFESIQRLSRYPSVSDLEYKPSRSVLGRRSSKSSNTNYMSFDDSDLSAHPLGEISSKAVLNVGTLSRQISPPQHSDVVYVMTKFALDLMRTLRVFNTENLQMDEYDTDAGVLRIGISNGEVMAGVVGSYKPHYDIWGNAVNMASRLDSTGIPGTIQVTKNTANILESFGVKCTYRGLTFIKGRGETPTYFVGIDNELNFIPKDLAAFQEKFNEYA